MSLGHLGHPHRDDGRAEDEQLVDEEDHHVESEEHGGGTEGDPLLGQQVGPQHGEPRGARRLDQRHTDGQRRSAAQHRRQGPVGLRH